jgi:hypothetical protein
VIIFAKKLNDGIKPSFLNNLNELLLYYGILFQLMSDPIALNTKECDNIIFKSHLAIMIKLNFNILIK